MRVVEIEIVTTELEGSATPSGHWKSQSGKSRKCRRPGAIAPCWFHETAWGPRNSRQKQSSGQFRQAVVLAAQVLGEAFDLFVETRHRTQKWAHHLLIWQPRFRRSGERTTKITSAPALTNSWATGRPHFCGLQRRKQRSAFHRVARNLPASCPFGSASVQAKSKRTATLPATVIRELMK